MNDSARDRTPRWIDSLIQISILYGILTMALETMPSLTRFGSFFCISEAIIVALFTVEYVVFWLLSDNKWRYPFRPMNVVDLLAILPFYLFIGADLRALRSVRLMRVFRVLRLARFSQAADTLGAVLRDARPELSVTALFAFILIMVCSTGLYYAEHETQPHAYSSIPATIWASVVTLTTVGYGDVYPVTALGRIISMFMMIAGIAFVALPTGIIGSRLTDLLQQRRESEREMLMKTVRYKAE